MRRERERSDILNNIDPNLLGSCLVVRMDQKGTIKKCNETFTKMMGKQDEDVLNAPFSMFLSKDPHVVDSWMDVLLRMNDNEYVSDLELPIQTGTGEDVVISWTNFPLKNAEKDNLNILNLVGTPVSASANVGNNERGRNHVETQGKEAKIKKTDRHQKSTRTEYENGSSGYHSKRKKKKLKIGIKIKTLMQKNRLKLTKDQKEISKNNKIEGKKKRKELTKDQKEISKNNKIEGKKKRKKLTKDQKETPVQFIEETLVEFQEVDKNIQGNGEVHKSIETPQMENTFEEVDNRYESSDYDEYLRNNSDKLSLLNKSQESKSYKTYFPDKKIIEKRDVEIENNEKRSEERIQDKAYERSRNSNIFSNKSIHDKNIHVEIKNLEKQNIKLEQRNKKLEKKIQSVELKRTDIKTFLNPRLCFIRDCINVDKKRKEFNYMMDQMNKRKQKIEYLENDMIFEKKEFKKKIEEFFTWREKLEQLEQEIEKRRKYLAEHEKFLNENFDEVINHELNQPASFTDEVISKSGNESEGSFGVVEEGDLFESLTVEAVVLERGRIKKVNSLFKKMIGFDEEEIIGKHLVDFVGPAGLVGVEQHYINRLKGVDDLAYDTVLLTKNENEIIVRVNVKASEFQGQRAEIVTFIEG